MGKQTSHQLRYHSTSLCADENGVFLFIHSSVSKSATSVSLCLSHLSVWLGRLPLLCLPFDSPNMFTGMASSLAHAFCSINLSPLSPIRNQSVQLAGRLVTEINGTDPAMTGVIKSITDPGFRLLMLTREKKKYLTNVVIKELWPLHVPQAGYLYSIKHYSQALHHHLLSCDMLLSQLTCCRIL